uniref:Hemicentin-2 n=1 Tax=Cacopsylla melanoneura TaxID=428564 RepID=A0A8D8T2I6_9HEMI
MGMLLIFLCYLCFFCGMTLSTNTSNDKTVAEPSPPAPKNTLSSTPNKHMLKPFFEDVGTRNITAVVGQVIYLKCHVKQIGERTVSWMRKRDLHILTTSIFTYTGDGRFSVIHPQNSDEWNLKIDYAQRRDAGIYECQVNTEPKMNMAFLINIEDAQATILGRTEQHVKAGSTISLTCIVNVHGIPPGSVVWFQESNKIDHNNSGRGGVSLYTEKTEKGTKSELVVTKATLTDSGNYTCVPSNAAPASVYIHVLNGEHPEAMQHGVAICMKPCGFIFIIGTIVIAIGAHTVVYLHRYFF